MHRKRLLYDYTRFTILLNLVLIGYTFYRLCISLVQKLSLFFTEALVRDSAYVFYGYNFPEFNFVLSLGLMSLIIVFVLIIEQVQKNQSIC